MTIDPVYSKGKFLYNLLILQIFNQCETCLIVFSNVESRIGGIFLFLVSYE